MQVHAGAEWSNEHSFIATPRNALQSFDELTNGLRCALTFNLSANPRYRARTVRTGVGMIKGASNMNRLVLSAATLALLSGIALAAPAQASGLTHSERVAIANSQHRLKALKWRVRADHHVSLWERMRVRAATARHKALVYRLRHN
jgi:hypothetical protein